VLAILELPIPARKNKTILTNATALFCHALSVQMMSRSNSGK
jgi:hypothetical protein